MAAAGSGGYGGPNFSAIERDLRGIAIQFGSILQITNQLRASVDTFRQLEVQLTLANAAAGGSRLEFQSMEQAARNFALASKFSASQVANSFYNLASAGLSVKETLAASTGVLLLSQATLTDLGEASDITASALAQFNLEASDSFRIANLFVASTNSSLSTVTKLGFALRQVGPIAAQANLSLEQTVGILDKLFDAGLRGEQAGTALRNAIARISDPEGEGKRLLENLGVETIDVTTGRMRDFIEIMKDLSRLNLSQSDISNIAGIEAAAGFTTMLQNLKGSADGANTSLEEHIRQITGTNAAYRMSVQQMNTLDGALSVATNSFNELRMMAGERMAPVLITLSQSFSDLVTNLRDLEDSALAGYVQLILLGVGTGVAIKAIGQLAPAMLSFAAASRQAIQGATTFGLAQRSIIQGSHSLGRTLPLASRGLSTMFAGFAGMAGAAAGLAGLAVAVAGIAAAMYKVNEEQKKMRLDEVVENIYQRAGQGQSVPRQQSLMDTKDYSREARVEFNRTPLISNVDANTGEGVGQRIAIRRAQIMTYQDDIKRLVEQQKALGEYTNEQRETYERTFRDLAAFLTVDFNSINGLSAAGQAEQGQDVIAGLTQVSAASDANIRQALIAYYDRRIAAVRESKNIGEGRKREMEQQYNALQEEIVTANNDVLISLRDQLPDRLRQAQDQLADNPNILRAQGDSFIRRLIRDVFDGAETQMVASKEDIAERQQKLRTQQTEFENLIKQAGDDINNQNNAIAAAIGTGIITAAGATGEQQAKMAEFLKNNPKAVQEAINKVKENNGEVLQGIRSIADAMVAAKLLQRGEIDKAVESFMATPLLDKQKLEQNLRRANIEMMEAQIQLAELTKGRADPALVQRLIDAKDTASGQNVIDEFFSELAGADRTTRQQVDALLQNAPMVAGIRADLERYAYVDREEQVRIETAITELLRSRNIRDEVGNIPLLVARYGMDARTSDLRTLVEGAQFRQRQNRGSGAGARSAARTVDRLLDLPTDAELAVERREMEIAAKYAINEFLNNPVIAARKALEETSVEAERAKLELQSDFEKYFSDSIAKGTAVENNVNLRNAFAGRGFEFGGSQYTQELLAGTAEEQRTYVEAAMRALTASLPASSSEYQKRIEQARRVLDNLPAQVSSLYTKFSAELDVAQLDAENAMREIVRFRDSFNAQAMIDLLTQSVASGNVTEIDLPNVMNIAAQVNLSRVTIDRNETIAKLETDFQEAFASYGVQMQVEVDGSLKLTNTEFTQDSYAPAIAALQDAYNKQRAAIDAAATARREFYSDSANAQILAQAAVIDEFKQAWDATGGAVQEARQQISGAANDFAQARLEATKFIAASDLANSVQGIDAARIAYNQLRDAIIEARAAEIRAERDKAIAALRNSAEYQALITGDNAARATAISMEGEITNAAERRIEALTTSTDVMRDSVEAYIEALRQASDMRVDDSLDDLGRGIQAGFAQIASDIPTYFEIAMDSTTQLISGFSDLFASTFLDMGSNVEDWEDKFREGAAGILRSISQMIIKMLVMAATLQLIRMIPGGTALLSALDAGANLGTAINTGVTVGSTVAGAKNADAIGNGATFNPSKALMADSITASVGEAVGYAGNGKRTSDLTSPQGMVVHLQSSVIVQGNASAEDAQAIGEEQVKQVSAMLIAKDAERDRQAARRQTQGYNPRGTF